jgi:hypothetical protein
MHQVMRTVDVSEAHLSVRIGRLTGLAYLGEWRPAFEALAAGSSSPLLPDIARNAILWTDPGHVALWLAARLSDPEVSRPAFNSLSELKQFAEQRAGRLVPAPASGRSCAS